MKTTLAVMMVLSVALCGVAGAETMYMVGQHGDLDFYEWDTGNTAGSTATHTVTSSDRILSPFEWNGSIYFGRDNSGFYGYNLTTTVTTTLSSLVADTHAQDVDRATGNLFQYGGGNVLRRYLASGGVWGSVDATSASPAGGWGNYITTGPQDIQVVGTTVYFSPGNGNGAPWTILTLPTTFAEGATPNVLYDAADALADGLTLSRGGGLAVAFDGTIFSSSEDGVVKITPAGDFSLIVATASDLVRDIDARRTTIYVSFENYGVRAYDFSGTLLAEYAKDATLGHASYTAFVGADPGIPEPAGLGLLGIALLGLRKRRS